MIVSLPFVLCSLLYLTYHKETLCTTTQPNLPLPQATSLSMNFTHTERYSDRTMSRLILSVVGPFQRSYLTG